MGWASVKSQFIIHLKILWYAYPQPNRINSVQNALGCLGGHGLYSAPVNCGIDGIQTVEPDRASQVTGADQINLMGLVGRKPWEIWIFLALWDVSSGPTMRQFPAA
jgi:hypothetical protein